MGTAEIIAEQRKTFYIPYIRCAVTGGDTYTTTDAVNRIQSVYQRQEPYKEIVDIVLKNGDKALSSLDIRGRQITLGFGFVIGGTPDYISQPPVWVIDQEFDSRPGKLTLTLHCQGTISCINDDKANAEFTAGDDDVMSDLIEDILDSTLLPYNHCTAYTVDWSGVTLGTDVNLFKPASNFQAFLNSNRLDMLRLLLDHTYVYPRPASDGSIDFIKPAQGGYDYEYELGGNHTFLIKLDSRRVTTPSFVIIYGGTYDENTDTWKFQSSSPGSAPSDTWFESFAGITSTGECQAVAAALLSNFSMSRRVCTALVPFNCTAKLFDYVQITDTRQGDSATGNIGYIVRRYESGSYQMEIGFGGWASGRKIAQFVSATRAPVKASATTWLTASCPETYLLPGDYITFHIIPHMHGGADNLLVKAYGCYAGGVEDVKIRIIQNGVVKWSKEAQVYNKLWTFCAVGVTDAGQFDFTIKNENETDACYVSGFCTYGLTTGAPG
jgi:hypothetical protein